MKIVIDARLLGPKDTGNGRYTENLIQNLINIDSENNYIVLLRREMFDILDFPVNFQKKLVDIKHYTFAEQFRMPIILYKLKPDLVHFPHFNVPIFYFGKFIVTIHDLIMHKFSGGDATSRKFPIYQIWRFGYYLSFAKAVYGSKKIIVPTKSVKKELLKYYKVNMKKVEVVYEG